MFPQLRSFPKHIIGVKNGEGGEWRPTQDKHNEYISPFELP